jgi:hypothetical protein
MQRIQARRGNGRFTRNTLRNTFGLGCDVCPRCGQCHPYRLRPRDPRATECTRCGAALSQEAS